MLNHHHCAIPMKRLFLLLFVAFPLTGQAQTTSTLVPLQSVWKYLDNGSNQGTAWRAAAFADTAWAEGAGQLGYGDGDEATIVSYGANASAKYITTYLRKHFTVESAAAVTAANLRLRRDDGVVVYLNGTEIYRNTMPTGTITYTTLATAAIGGTDESTLLASTVNAALLVNGDNVLAVEVHQSNATSSDLTFDLEFNVTVSAPPTGAPVANAQSVTLNEDTAEAIILTGSDPEESPLTFTILTAPAKGTLSGTPPAVNYLPNADATGPDSFSFKVNDGTYDSAAAAVSLTILGVNDLPVANAQTVPVANGTATTVTLNGSDVESRLGQFPDYTQEFYSSDLTAITDGLSGATWNADSGTLFLIRNVSAGGGTSYEYTAEGTHLRTITQSGFQDTEAIAWMYGNTYAIAEENDFQRITICTIAPGATTLDRTAAGNQTWNTGVGSLLNLGIESLCYDAGRDLLYYLAEKPSGGTWNIYAMNPATGVSTVLCDLNASILAAAVATDVGDMAFDRATDTMLLLSHESSKIIRVSRGGVVLEQRGFTTAVTQAEALALTPDRQRLFVGGEPKQFARYALPAETLTYSITSLPAHGTLSGLPPTLTYLPEAGYVGTDSFTFTLSDGITTSPPATVWLTVAPFNAAPVAENQAVTLNEDSSAAVVLTATDAEGSALTYTITAPPAKGTLSGTAPNLTYTPAANADGSDSFSWTASDGSATSAPAVVSITIAPVNDAPVAAALAIAVEMDTAAMITLPGSDPENTPLSYSVLSLPTHGTLTGTPPNLSYLPAAGYTGTDAFTYRVNDGEFDSADAIVSLTVSASVLDTLVTSGSTWKYLDNGSNQGTAWRAPSFDDSTWSSGLAQLGYGDGDEAKVVGYGPDANNRYITTYFRHEFQLANPGVITSGLKLDLLRDDGAVVYLNGTEILRSGMPAGTVSWNTLASSSIGAPAESTFYTTTLGSNLLVAGRNVLAVEVHQGAVTSSDLSFDLRLYEGQPAITRGPYVQMTGPDRATVRWRTDVATTSRLDYGLSTAALTSTASSATLKTEHEITVTGLTPDTRFYYGAGHSSGLLSSGSTFYFTTHPPAGTVKPYRFWVLGDPGTGDANQTAVRDAFYTWNGTQELAGVLVLGDTVYETGTDLEFQNKFFNVYPALMRNTTFWPTFGNHDAGSASSSTQSGPYYDSFTMPKAGEAGGVASGTEAYYSFNIGNIHFVCLDSEGSSRLATGNMAAWLEQDLNANLEEWTVAFWHHPAYSKGSHDSDVATADSGKMKNMREVFVPILENHGVDLLLFGHEHNYQRSKFIDGHYDVSSTFDPATMLKQAGLGDPAVDGPYVKSPGPHNGAVFTVAGSSGKLTVATLNHAAMAVNRTELGSVVLDVTGRELVARFINSTGVVRDTFSIVHNSAPLANEATFTGNEDASLAVTLGGTDDENDVLTYAITTPPVVGTLTGTAPALTYTPPVDFQGSTTFQFTVNDGRVTSTPVTVTLNISGVNDAPLALGQSVSTAEDIAAAITLAGTDADGDLLTFTLTANPVHGLLTGVLPNLTFVPEAGWSGTDSFAFTVSDGTATSAPVVVSLTVTPVNDLPVATAADLATNEDTALAVTLAGTDPEDDVLTFAVADGPAHGTISGTGANLTYTPDADWEGVDAFTFSASDGQANSLPGTVTITVAPVNDAPLAAVQAVTVAEDTDGAITLTGNDADGDVLTYVVTTQPIHGILTGTAPALIYTPEADWNGPDSFAFTVSDGTVTSAPAVVSLTVTPVNDVPLAVAQAVATDEDTALPVTLTASDVDGDVLTFTVTVPPIHGLLSGTAPALTYTPEPDWNGPDQFEFTAHDAAGASLPATVTITVAPVNDVPVAMDRSFATMKNVPVPTTLQATDVEGDALMYVITVPPAHGMLSGTAPALVYTPEANWNGTDSFSYTAGDAAGNSPAATVTLTVSATNTAPVAVAQTVAVSEDTLAALTLAGTDADGNVLTFIIVTPPLHGSLSGTLPNLVYTPEPDWNGAEEFTFRVNDGTEDSLPGLVAVSVAPVNDVPAAVAQSITTTEDLAASLTLAGSDVDGDVLTFSVTVPPVHGTLSGAGAALVYTPDPDWNGADSFSFTAGDGVAVSVPAVVSLTVTAVNDVPVATAVNAVTEVGIPIALTLTGSDAEGDALTWDIASVPARGTLSGSGAAWTYTPNPAWAGTDEFTFTVSDGSGTSLVTTATITVASSGPWQLIARTGHAAPGAGGAAFSIFQTDYVSDAAGRASFRATAGSVTGIWTEGPAGLEAVAVQAAAAPGVTGAVFDSITTGPWAAGDGELLVFGKLRTGTGGVTTSNDLGYWHRSNDAAALVARENDPVPGMPAAARFNVLSAVATLEAGGNYAFAGSMKTNSSLAITTANDTGLWATFGAPARLLVRENQAAPGTTGLFDTLTTAGLVSNGAGQLGFSTSMKTGGTITTANRYGLWMLDPEQFGLVARSVSAAPGTPTGALFGQPLSPSFGDGAMAFRSALATGSGGVTNSNETGLWILENGVVNLLAREGFQAPGVGAGGLFNGFTEGASLNSGNELAFRTALRTGSGVTSANNAGLWVRSRFTGNTLTLAARKGFPAPGAGSATFASFDLPFVADDGGEVFTAILTVSTATGVTTSNDRGLWLRNAAGALTPALREGMAFTLAPGDIRTISNITLPAARSSGRTPLSGEGRLLVLMTFTDGSSALYHYILP